MKVLPCDHSKTAVSDDKKKYGNFHKGKLFGHLLLYHPAMKDYYTLSPKIDLPNDPICSGK